MNRSTAVGFAEQFIGAATPGTEGAPPRDGGEGAAAQPVSAVVSGLFGEAWEAAPRLLRRGCREPAALLDRERLEGFILADRADPVRTSFIMEGVARPLTPGRPAERLDLAARLYAEGCSLLVTRVEEVETTVAALCRELDFTILRGGMALAAPTSANAYLGPSGASGFPLHYDDHCALVLQLAGTKQWTVYPPAQPLPTSRCEHAVAQEELGAPCLEARLAPGDMLYVPRGFPHRARAGGAGSLHVTLALRTLTWRALLADEEAIDAVWRSSARPSADALRVPRKRRALPELEERSALSLSALAPLAGRRFAAIDGLAALACDALLVRPPHMMLLHRAEGEEALLHYPGGVLRLPLAMAPVFAFLAANERFTLRDLPDCSADYDRRELVGALVRRGLVVPDSCR